MTESAKIKNKQEVNSASDFSIMIKKEIFRKTIHISSAFVPYFYFFIPAVTMISMLLLTLGYFLSEIMRMNKIKIPIITEITELASRNRDDGKIILGPVTLSLGVFLSLTLFDYRVAVIAIFALSFGDGVASLYGKILRGVKIPFTSGKTVSGSMGCFLTLIFVFYSCGLSPKQSIILALFATIVEVFPTGDFDNLLIPVAVGVFSRYFIL